MAVLNKSVTERNRAEIPYSMLPMQYTLHPNYEVAYIKIKSDDVEYFAK